MPKLDESMQELRLTNSIPDRFVFGCGVVIFFARLSFGFLVSILFCLSLASGQSPPKESNDSAIAQSPEKVFRRFDLFQMLLEERGLVPVEKLADALMAPADSAIVVAGNPATVPNGLWSECRAFVQRGGTLLVLDEYAWSITGLGRFRSGPVAATQSTDSYQGHLDCLMVRDIVDPDSILQGVSTLVTNRSNWFEPASASWFTWQTLARFPVKCEPAESQGRDLLAIGRTPGRDSGFVLVAADASLLTNGMLWHGDNALLAIRIADVLQGSVLQSSVMQGSSKASKGQLYFVDNGRVLGSYREQLALPSAGLSPPATGQVVARPDIQTLLSFANAVAKDAINSGMLNETLRQRPRHWTAADYFRWLVGSLMLIALFVILWRLAVHRPMKRTIFGFRRMISGYEMRNPVSGGNADFHNPAADLAREFCLELTGTRMSAEWQKYLGRITAVTERLSRAEQQALTRIFDIASRGSREKMSSSEFQQLGKTLADLRRDHLESLRLSTSTGPIRVKGTIISKASYNKPRQQSLWVKLAKGASNLLKNG